MKLKILYEDNHLIAVYKPAGILTQSNESRGLNLMGEVKKHLKERYKKPGNVFLGLLHRLDRPVSGVILFAKTSKGASRLSEQFRNQTIEKIYHALVIGKPKQKRGMLIHFLKKDKKIKRMLIFENKKPGTKIAKLFYEVIASNNKYSLLKIQIKTGKFHQIRVQLSSIDCPVLGDLKYGAPFALPDRSIALSATSLSFQTATKNEKKQISVPIPAVWKEYIGT